MGRDGIKEVVMNLYDLIVAKKLSGGGGGPSVEVEPLSVTENGTYSASSGHAYSPVTVSCPQPSGNITITENGTWDVEDYQNAEVNVSGGGGDHDAEDSIIMKTISGTYTNDRITNVGASAFAECSKLTGIDFPNATTLGKEAFKFCSSLAQISCPKVATIYESAFFSCKGLLAASLPSATSIATQAFRYCSALAELYTPKLKKIDQSAFGGCSALTSFVGPSCQSIGTAAFQYCSELSKVQVGKSFATLSGSAFGYCSKLMEFIVSSGTSVPTLQGTTAFVGTPMSNSAHTGSFGSIYVPASLVSAYKSANNWSAYSDRITSYVE